MSAIPAKVAITICLFSVFIIPMSCATLAVTSSLPEITPPDLQVTMVPDLELPHPSPISSDSPYADLAHYGLDLDTIKQTFGSFLLPAYLPDGYELIADTTVIEARSLLLVFRNSKTHTDLLLTQDVVPSDMKYPTGTVEEVTVRGARAYLVHGNWGTYLGERTWRADVSLGLLFQQNRFNIILQGAPARAWTAEELIKIAESLALY